MRSGLEPSHSQHRDIQRSGFLEGVVAPPSNELCNVTNVWLLLWIIERRLNHGYVIIDHAKHNHGVACLLHIIRRTHGFKYEI